MAAVCLLVLCVSDAASTVPPRLTQQTNKAVFTAERNSVSDTETVLMNELLMSMIPAEGTEPPEGLLQLAADFWLTNRRHFDSETALPLLTHPGLPHETAERIVKADAGCAALMRAYLARPDPVDVMARQIAEACPNVLCLAVSGLQEDLRLEVAELLADVEDEDLLLNLGHNQHTPYLTRVRAVVRAHNMFLASNGTPDPKVARCADDLFKYHKLGDADDVVGALRLLQDTQQLLSRFEQYLSISKTAVVTDEAVALLRWSPHLKNLDAWGKTESTRTAVFDYLNGRFGMHAPSWDMFAKLASPDQRIGEIADLVLEVETSDS